MAATADQTRPNQAGNGAVPYFSDVVTLKAILSHLRTTTGCLSARIDAMEARAAAESMARARPASLGGMPASGVDEAAKLRAAIRRGGLAVMQTSGDWSIHDVSDRAQAEDAKSLEVATKNVDLTVALTQIARLTCCNPTGNTLSGPCPACIARKALQDAGEDVPHQMKGPAPAPGVDRAAVRRAVEGLKPTSIDADGYDQRIYRRGWDACHDAARAALSQLAGGLAIADEVRETPAADAGGGWVRTPGQFPPDGRTVLVFSDHRNRGGSAVMRAAYREDGRWRMDGSAWEVDLVTHWRDLPAPPPADPLGDAIRTAQPVSDPAGQDDAEREAFDRDNVPERHEGD